MTTALAAVRVAAPVELDFEARLAATDAAMTVRLEEAGIGWQVNTAHIPAGPVIEHLLVDAAPADDSTPVAALLRRAQARILRDGWSQSAARTGTGGMCLSQVIQAEARSHREEGEARILLRRALGGGDSIPEMNRRLGSAGQAAHVLGQAAELAERSGL